MVYISFIPIALLQNCRDYKYFTIEPYIYGKYTKYNDNNGYVNENQCEANEVANAFSHFSYENSNEKLIIVDMQGKIIF